MRKPKLILIAKDGFPVEEIIGRPIINFIRRFLHGDHYECRDCWESKRACKNPDTTQSSHPLD